jgi:hypothetical protein
VDQSDLADTPPVQFIAGVAGDLQIADERAISMATNWVAGHCRSRIVEVGVGLRGAGESEAQLGPAICMGSETRSWVVMTPAGDGCACVRSHVWWCRGEVAA